MIKIETYQEPIEVGSDLWQMFRARAEVFHRRLKWNVEVYDGLEIDRYDRHEEPVYLLSYQDEMLVGSIRFLPTTGNTMLKHEFSAMFNEPVDIVSATAWEGTRFCIHPTAKNEQSVSRDLFIGMHELAYKSGVEHIIGLYDARMIRIYRRIGWNPTELARTIRPGETLIVGIWDVTADALAAMQSKDENTRRRVA